MDISSVKFLPVTGFLLASTAAVTLPVLVSYIKPLDIALDWNSVLYDWAVWRPFTTFFFGGSGLQLLFDVFCLFHTSTDLEQTHFQDTAAYSWTVTVLGIIILAVNQFPVFKSPILFGALLNALIYIWARENPTARVSIFGLIKVPTRRVYPFVLVVIHIVQGGLPGAMLCVLGILTGHLWWFVTKYLPLHAPAHLRRRNPFAVPRWYRTLFQQRLTASTAANASKSVAPGVTVSGNRFANANDAVRHRWGSGQRLGAE